MKKVLLLAVLLTVLSCDSSMDDCDCYAVDGNEVKIEGTEFETECSKDGKPYKGFDGTIGIVRCN